MGEGSDTQLLMRQWLEKAQHDAGIAETLLSQHSPYTDGICFHCQEAVEKMAKATLIALGIPFKRNHNLAYLADLLSERMTIPDDLRDQMENLEDYAVEVRYPDAMIEPTMDEAKAAVSTVHAVSRFIKQELANRGFVDVSQNEEGNRKPDTSEWSQDVAREQPDDGLPEIS